MAGMRYQDIAARPHELVDWTSLTPDEFRLLLPSFDQAFFAHMADWRLDGLPRTGRSFSVYKTCPLPTPEDRLFFVLVYLKTYSLQLVHGRLFGMGQPKANQWLHVLLPALQIAFRSLGLAPSRTLADLAARLDVSLANAQTILTTAASDQTSDEASAASAALLSQSDTLSSDPRPSMQPGDAETASGAVLSPLFRMMEPNDASRAPRTRMHREAVTLAREKATPSKTCS